MLRSNQADLCEAGTGGATICLVKLLSDEGAYLASFAGSPIVAAPEQFKCYRVGRSAALHANRRGGNGA